MLRHLPVHFHLELVLVVMRGGHLQAQVAVSHGVDGGFGPRDGVGARPVGGGGRGRGGERRGRGELVGEVFFPLCCGVEGGVWGGGTENKC